MGIFGFLKKSKDKGGQNTGLCNEREISLFENDMSSEAFLQKVRALKDINKKFQRGMNLLHFACEYNNITLAKEVIHLKINIEEKNNYGNTPLWTAVFNSKGKYELVDLLLANGADPDSVNNAKNTPLKFAETINDQVLIKKLQDAKGNKK